MNRPVGQGGSMADGQGGAVRASGDLPEAGPAHPSVFQALDNFTDQFKALQSDVAAGLTVDFNRLSATGQKAAHALVERGEAVIKPCPTEHRLVVRRKARIFDFLAKKEPKP